MTFSCSWFGVCSRAPAPTPPYQLLQPSLQNHHLRITNPYLACLFLAFTISIFCARIHPHTTYGCSTPPSAAFILPFSHIPIFTAHATPLAIPFMLFHLPELHFHLHTCPPTYTWFPSFPAIPLPCHHTFHSHTAIIPPQHAHTLHFMPPPTLEHPHPPPATTQFNHSNSPTSYLLFSNHQQDISWAGLGQVRQVGTFLLNTEGQPGRMPMAGSAAERMVFVGATFHSSCCSSEEYALAVAHGDSQWRYTVVR